MAAATFIGFLGVTTPVAALDVDPGNYVPFSAGTNLIFGYYQYFDSDRFVTDNGSTVPDSDIAAQLGIVRDNYYNEIDGIPWCLHVIFPFGSITHARVGGVQLPTTSGAGDLITGLTVWPVHNPDEEYGTYLGISHFFVVPSGHFDPSGVGLGSGSLSFVPEIGLVQRLGHGLVLNANADARVQLDHSEQGRRYSTDPSYQVQAYFGYSLTPTARVWAGYSGQFAGKAFTNGAYSGQKTRNDEIRVFADTFITSSTQIQVMVARDVSASGGFQKDIYTQIRFVKAFFGHNRQP